MARGETRAGPPTVPVPDLDDVPSLLSDFSAVPVQRWQAKVEEALGKSVSSLDRATLEGPTIRPLRTAEDGEPGPRPPARTPGWSIAQEYGIADPAQLHEAVVQDVARGLEVAWIEMDGDLRAAAAVPVRRPGAIVDAETVAALVDAVGPGVAVQIDAGLGAPSLARALVQRRGATALADAVLCDPLAVLASTGGLGMDLSLAYGELAQTTRDVAQQQSPLRTILADAVPAHDAGASAEQEVAVVVAAALGHLNGLASHGLSPAEIMPRLVLRLAVGGDVLLEVAKLRAVARLWARVRAHAGAGAGPSTPLVVRSSWRASTRCDPWVNLLRGTTAGVAAVLGGARVVAVQPFTEAQGQPDAAARRWAVNTQHILRGEAHLGAVDDPAAGSWSFEAATDDLARGAWVHVQRWLEHGGLAAGLESGMVQAEIAERGAARSQALATGAQIATGTTVYPSLDERRPEVTPTEAATRSLTTPPAMTVRPLPRRRVAEPFETLRDHSDAHRVAAGGRPTAVLVAVGEPGTARAQIDFARSFVGIAGFEGQVVDPGAEPLATVPLVILCGKPDALAEHGAAQVRGWLAAAARRVLVAGRPTDALRQAGVHDFVHRGRDVVALATALQTTLMPAAEVRS